MVGVALLTCHLSIRFMGIDVCYVCMSCCVVQIPHEDLLAYSGKPMPYSSVLTSIAMPVRVKIINALPPT